MSSRCNRYAVWRTSAEVRLLRVAAEWTPRRSRGRITRVEKSARGIREMRSFDDVRVARTLQVLIAAVLIAAGALGARAQAPQPQPQAQPQAAPIPAPVPAAVAIPRPS